jgi:hypothetical protein
MLSPPSAYHRTLLLCSSSYTCRPIAAASRYAYGQLRAVTARVLIRPAALRASRRVQACTCPTATFARRRCVPQLSTPPQHCSATHNFPAADQSSQHQLQSQVISARDSASHTAANSFARSAAASHLAHLTLLNSATRSGWSFITALQCTAAPSPASKQPIEAPSSSGVSLAAQPALPACIGAGLR